MIRYCGKSVCNVVEWVKEMAVQKQEKTGYIILTYRLRLYDRHMKLLLDTKHLYNQVAAHFFAVLCQRKSLLELSDFLLLRELEALCIGTKEQKKKGRPPEFPLADFPKIPLYFRRSAINAAITMVRKNSNNGWKQEEALDFPMVLYQGMYQEFNDRSIELKLFDGNGWKWFKFPFTGRDFPDGAKKLSPTLMFRKKQAYLNVPVRMEVSDIRTVKERMLQEEYLCAVAFPDYDVSAAAVIMDKQGNAVKSCFFRGGKEREHQRKKLQERLEKSRNSRGFSGPEENKSIYTEMRRLNRHFAHTISKQLLDYCVQQEIKLIVAPNYEDSIDFRDKQYLKTDSYRWLGRSIIKNLKYKAFREGIVVTSVKPYKISRICSECGEEIQRYNEGHAAGSAYLGGKLFTCPNGHSGNAAENSARNIGKLFLGYFTESV